MLLKEVIKKVGDKYVVYPKKGGDRLGTHPTKAKAMKQLKAIHANENTLDTILSPEEVFKIYKIVKKEVEKEGSFKEAFPLGTTFFFAIYDKLDSKISGSYIYRLYKHINSQIQQKGEDFLDLYTLPLTFYHTMKNIKEQTDGTVSTDDEATAEKLAKKGINVALKKEQEVEQEIQEIPSESLSDLATTVESALLDGLRGIGEEIAESSTTVTSGNTFQINIKFKNKEEEVWKYEVRDNDKLVLTDTIPEEILADIEVLPSGEILINTPVLADNINKYLSMSYISEFNTDYKNSDTDSTVLSIGHDDEARMMKQSAYEIMKYGEKLYDIFSAHSSLDTKVDYPHWLQSLVVKARDHIGKATHYLEYQQKKIDAKYGIASLTPSDRIKSVSEKSCKMGIISELELEAVRRACDEGLYELAIEYLYKKAEMKKRS